MATKRQLQDDTKDDRPPPKLQRQNEQTETGGDATPKTSQSDGNHVDPVSTDRQISVVLEEDEAEQENTGDLPVVEIDDADSPERSEGADNSNAADDVSQHLTTRCVSGTIPKIVVCQVNLSEPNPESEQGSNTDGSSPSQNEAPESLERLASIEPSSKPELRIDDFVGEDILQVLGNHYAETKSPEVEDFLIKKGRPTPILLKSDTITDPKTGTALSLSEFTYRKIPWLTGSEALGQFFCWPCLLFSSKDKWSLSGDVGWKQSSIAILKHSLTPGHIAAFKTLKQREDSMKPPVPDISQDAPAGEKPDICSNRRFAELLIRILCSKTNKHNNTVKFFAEYEELMQIALRRDPELGDFASKELTEVGLMNFVASHAVRLYESIVHVVKSSIHREIQDAPHVIVLFQDMADVVDKSSQVAVIVRYVDKKGRVRERFLRLVRNGLPTTTSINNHIRYMNMFKILTAVVSDFNLEEKLFGFALSGTIVLPSLLSDLKEATRTLATRANYFHWPGISFKELLLQALSHVELARDFFQVVNDLVEFFATNSGAIPTLVNFVKTSTPDCPWLYEENSFTHDIVCTIKLSYPLFVKFFQRVSKKFWNDEVARQAPNFVSFLTRLETKLLVFLVSGILTIVSDLSKAIEKNRLFNHRATAAIAKLQEIKRMGAVEFMHAASKVKDVYSYEMFKDTNLHVRCDMLFDDILLSAIRFVRIGCLTTTPFFVGNPSQTFSDIKNSKLLLDRYVRSRGEVGNLYCQMDCFGAYDLMFLRKALPEYVPHMEALGLTRNLPDLLDYIKFCLLVTPTEPDPDMPIHKLKKYARDKQRLSSDEALLFFEKDSIAEMMNDGRFFDDVFNHYANVNEPKSMPTNDSPARSQTTTELHVTL